MKRAFSSLAMACLWGMSFGKPYDFEVERWIGTYKQGWIVHVFTRVHHG